MSINYADREKEQMVMMFSILHSVKKVRIKKDIFNIVVNHYGKDEYDKDDERYFESIAGQECLVYCYDRSFQKRKEQKDDWFILLDDNYCFTEDCFEIISSYI